MGVEVFLVGEGLSLTMHDLGSLIHSYTDYCTDFPQFCVSDGVLGGLYSGDIFTHLSAGFLGIPGNLITCTVPHGLAISASYDIPSEVQAAGDDVGAAYYSEDHAKDVLCCASTLGTLQFDKVYRTPQESLFLKRRVIVKGDSIDLAEMLIYPLLPYLVNPTSRNFKSVQYRMPSRDKIFSRTAGVVVSFMRDLWKYTKGVLDVSTADTIYAFLLFIHDKVGLPRGAIFQGLVYGDSDESNLYAGVSLKFSVEDISCLYSQPDRVFASKFVYRMTVRDTSMVEPREDFRGLQVGERFVVDRRKGWRFLEDMGYVKILGIPGEKVHLFGTDARDAFMNAREPSYREVEVISELDDYCLSSVGLMDESASFSERTVDKVWTSRMYTPYVDLDEPRYSSFGIDVMFGDDEEEEHVFRREDFSPEPDLSLLY